MAASEFFWYLPYLKKSLTGGIGDLSTNRIMAIPMGDGYIPDTASHSLWVAAISTFQASASGSVIPAITLSGVTIGQSAGASMETIKFDANDISGFSQGGDTIVSLKYMILAELSATNTLGLQSRLIGFFDLNTDSADASVGESTQVNVSFNASGIGKLRGNP